MGFLIAPQPGRFLCFGIWARFLLRTETGFIKGLVCHFSCRLWISYRTCDKIVRIKNFTLQSLCQAKEFLEPVFPCESVLWKITTTTTTKKTYIKSLELSHVSEIGLYFKRTVYGLGPSHGQVSNQRSSWERQLTSELPKENASIWFISVPFTSLDEKGTAIVSPFPHAFKCGII